MEKSQFLVDKIASWERIQTISREIGFSLKIVPIIYLGVPIFQGRAKLNYFEEIFIKITKRCDCWASRFLFKGGKLILVKHVLESMLVYLLYVYYLPKSISGKLEGKVLGSFGVLMKANRR